MTLIKIFSFGNGEIGLKGGNLDRQHYEIHRIVLEYSLCLFMEVFPQCKFFPHHLCGFTP